MQVPTDIHTYTRGVGKICIMMMPNLTCTRYIAVDAGTYYIHTSKGEWGHVTLGSGGSSLI